MWIKPRFKIHAFSITGMDRGTCWSITINNPTEEDLNPTLPPGWKTEGQIEEGAEGTQHYQGMVNTPQVRFSAVKKVFPRAHIELARNRAALQKYVHKDETRLAEVANKASNIPTLFDYQHTIASKWDDEEFSRFRLDPGNDKKSSGDLALEYVDTLVEKDIKLGVNGVEYIAINPMWRSAWKRFWKAMVERERLGRQKIDRQTECVIEELDPTVEIKSEEEV